VKLCPTCVAGGRTTRRAEETSEELGGRNPGRETPGGKLAQELWRQRPWPRSAESRDRARSGHRAERQMPIGGRTIPRESHDPG